MKSHYKILVGVLIVGIVLIGGILTWQYFGIPKGEVKVPKVKTPTTIIKDEIADWKTYSNEEYNYEVKYPKDWYFLKDACCPPPPTGITLNNYSDKKSEFSQHQFEKGVLNFDILCLYEGKLDEIGEVKLLKEEKVEYEYLTINGAEAIKFVKNRVPNQSEEKAISYYIVNGNSGCRIIFSSKCAICNQMLSTFRFIE